MSARGNSRTMDTPDWAKELNETLQQVLKEKGARKRSASPRSQALSCVQEVDKSFREHLKEHGKGRISISLDRSEPPSPTSQLGRKSREPTSPTSQTRKEVTSVITAVQVESTTVESQAPLDNAKRKSRLRRATMQTEEAKELSARLRALSDTSNVDDLKRI